MTFTVDDFMRHSVVLANKQWQYDLFCDRMRRAGFTDTPIMYSDALPDCLAPAKFNLRCGLNHFNIVKMARCLGWDHVTVFEWDAYPMIECRNALGCFLGEGGIPDIADVVSFGNLFWIRDKRCGVAEAVDSGRYFRISDLWGSQAVLYPGSGFDNWINGYCSVDSKTACSSDTFHMITRNSFHASRSFFLQVKHAIQYYGTIKDRENIRDFPVDVAGGRSDDYLDYYKRDD